MQDMASEIKLLEQKARYIRKLIVEMIFKAGSGHPGGSLSLADILTCLYFSVMRHDPSNPTWPERDRFHLSKGHACPAWYAVLACAGYFPESHLWTLRKLGSILQGHPDKHTPGIDVASGSLGQGLSVALGIALAGKLDQKNHRVYCALGDGELQEGNVWEAAMAAAHFGAHNLCAIVDHNRFQIDGQVESVMSIHPLPEKWKSFGWHVLEIDGHSFEEILCAFRSAQGVLNAPTVIIASTTKGKGVSLMENVLDFHGRAPTKEERERAIQELSKD